MVTRRVLALVATLGVAATSLAPAGALEPWVFDPGRDTPPAEQTNPSPGVEMQQRTQCATNAVLPNSQFHNIPASLQFGVGDLHRFADGTGQKVAVIDSGVSPNVRLPRLTAGGDYIAGGDGLDDCDHHGTLIAGIIAAQPALNDNFIGVAPGAEIISIRQTSSAFTPRSREDQPSSLDLLAKAVRRATDLGATVINMSVTACVDDPNRADSIHELAGALHYAAHDHDVVLVASAGNTNQECESNPGPSPDNTDDPRGWGNATTASIPSIFDDDVLSVAAVGAGGEPYPNTMAGPWVDVAAPGENIISLDPLAGESGGLINATIGPDGQGYPIMGTSFAAAYVSGLAALIRQYHPDLNASQVRQRIIDTASQTAEAMNNIYGNGIVNATAALTGTVDTSPSGGWGRQHIPPIARIIPQHPAQWDPWPVIIAGLLLTIAGVIAVEMVFKYRIGHAPTGEVRGDIEADPDHDLFKTKEGLRS